MSRVPIKVAVILVWIATSILVGCDTSGVPSNSTPMPDLQATVSALQTQVAANPTNTPLPSEAPPTITLPENIPTAIIVPTVEPTIAPTQTASGGSAVTPSSVAPTASEIATSSVSSPTFVSTTATTTIPGGGFPVKDVESAHPYNNKFDDTWFLPNLEAQASGTRLHFSRLDLEKDVDWLIVLDVNDQEVQRFTGSYPDGAWTDLIPGAFVKLRLITDATVQRWGFQADRIQSVIYQTQGHSPHPYPNNANAKANIKWRFDNPDQTAAGTRLHFSRLDLEENVDWLVVMGVDGTPYQWITGHHPDGLWTLAVTGSIVSLQLYSDATVSDWGFNVDKAESSPPDQPQPGPEAKAVLAETNHPYQAGGPAKTWTLINPDPDAATTKIHFSKVDMGNSTLILRDANDKVRQSINQEYADAKNREFWSDDITGRVVRVEFNPGYSTWGFRVDQIATGSNIAPLAESEHPYQAGGPTQTLTIINPDPNATTTKVHFSRVDMGNSYLALLDGNDNVQQTISQEYADGKGRAFWSEDLKTRVVKIQFKPGYSTWGFRIDRAVNGEP